MSVPVENSKDVRLGDGQTKVWPFSFVVTDPSQIHVIRVRTDKTQIELSPGSFEITLKDTGIGGNVEYPVLEGDNDILEDGEKIIIYRNTDLLSDFSPKNGETFDPESIMVAIDKLTLQNQEQAEQLARSVKTDMTGDVVPDELLTSIIEAEAMAVKKAAEAEQSANLAGEKAQVSKEQADRAKEISDAFDNNAAEKTASYNQNHTEKMNIYNANDSSKMNAYNQNHSDKYNAYNTNDEAKTAAYNQNHTEKMNAYDANDAAKTIAFNNNSIEKLTSFNENAATKQASIDAALDLARQYANADENVIVETI